jgi:N-acetyl-alpha-D-muramate 1-phosphate uridylyltransferase
MNKPKKAFILAAGKGTRLRPHTDSMPKPMVPIAGRSIIKRTIEKLAAEGVEKIVINLHHLGDVLEDHLKDITTPKIIFSQEDELLETGGGLKKAIHYFGNEPYYIINGDALWDEGADASALSKMAALWDAEKMDILLFLEPKDKMILTEFVGDYHATADGKLTRAKDKNGAYMFAGLRIAHPRIFDQSPDGAFSFLQLMDKAEARGRLYGHVHDAEWYHISTPEDLAAVDAAFRQKGAV